jgi:hypothetical protein
MFELSLPQEGSHSGDKQALILGFLSSTRGSCAGNEIQSHYQKRLFP